MKSLLVPTDFSTNARTAIDYAVNFAIRTGSKVHIIHTIEPLEPTSDIDKIAIDEYNNKLLHEAEQKLDKLKAEVLDGNRVNIDAQVYEGSSVQSAILQAAEDYAADVIIMGTYGKTGVRRKLFGSRVAEIINKSSIPVLSIPPGYRWNGLYNMVLAIDQEQDTRALMPVFKLADLFNANLSVVIFTEEDAGAEEVITHTQTVLNVQHRLARAFPNKLFEVIHLVGDDFHKEMLNHITDNNVQMLAMLTTKRDAIESILESSYTQKMSYHTIVPLLSLHNTMPLYQ